MRSRVARWLPTAYLVALDVAAGVAVTAVYLDFAGQPAVTVPLWSGYALAALIGLPLAVRRRWPLAVLGVVVGSQSLATLLHITLEPFVPTAFALYMVAASVTRRRAVGALACALACLTVSILIGEPWPDNIALATFAVLGSSGSWALGRSTAVRRSYAQREAAELAARAVVDERMRIARELHDVVAHSLSLIAVKAGIANHVAARQPELATEALRVIETASRSTLVEMRRLLGVLRADAEAELAPMPGLADLPGLVEQASLAGVRVDLAVTGGELPEGVGLTVFRIVQESVTNVVKHAAPARCSVEVEVGDAVVRVLVVDDGPGRRLLGEPGDAGGHGLVGMRERVAVYGGTFAAGPVGGGGFRVAAEVPFG